MQKEQLSGNELEQRFKEEMGYAAFLLENGASADFLEKDFPTIRELMPHRYFSMKMRALSAEIDSTSQMMGTVGNDPEAVGKLMARRNNLMAEAATLVKKEHGDVEPVEVKDVPGIHADDARLIDVALELGLPSLMGEIPFVQGLPEEDRLRLVGKAALRARDDWKMIKDSTEGESDGFLSDGIPESQLHKQAVRALGRTA